MSELKCCPFCGGEAEIRHNVIWYWAQCKKCNVNTKESSNENIAIENWNTRKPMANIVEKLEIQLRFFEKRFARMSGSYRDLEDYGSIKAYKDAIDIVKQEINNGLE